MLSNVYQILAKDIAFTCIGLDFGEGNKTILRFLHHSKMLPKEFLAGSFVEDYEIWNKIVVLIYEKDRLIMIRNSFGMKSIGYDYLTL